MPETNLRGDKEVVVPAGNPAIREAGITHAMNAVVHEARGDSISAARSRIMDKTKMAWLLFKPKLHRTAWWAMLGVIVVMILLELDDTWSGSIYQWFIWFRQNVLKQFPVVPFILGALARHYIFKEIKD